MIENDKLCFEQDISENGEREAGIDLDASVTQIVAKGLEKYVAARDNSAVGPDPEDKVW